MKRILSLVLCLTLLFSVRTSLTARAAEAWPENVSVEADGAIVMDADTGTVLYGKNIHTNYYPASITKILTALIVLENCEMDEMVTFSYDAVYNVEAGSTSAGFDEGDVVSVKDCLYALVLKSANEAANALAEHVAGSREAFADLMNEKAASLGCQDSHFANPSGLNDPDHYTSAYDMALIGQEALKNETFMEINSTLYYDLPVTKRNPEGGRIYPGHKMLKKNLSQYYEGCIGGKTGYTSLAGNTLVTFARRNGMTLIAVVLNGHQTHYSDTKALLDFGFQNFQTVKAADYDLSYTSLENDMTIAGLSSSELSGLTLNPDSLVVLPKGGSFSSVTSQLNYTLPANASADTIAQVEYFWGDRKIGSAGLSLDLAEKSEISIPATTFEALTSLASNEESVPETSAPETEKPKGIRIPSVVWTVLGVIAALAVLAGLFIFLKLRQEKKEEEARLKRRQKRMERMRDSGISPAEFDLIMQNRRTSRTPGKSRKRPSSRHRR